MKKKQWTLSEKMEILEKAGSGDVVAVCRQYGVSTGTYYYWKKRFETRGTEGLKTHYDNRDKALKAAEEENRILRKLLADKEVELEIQRELVKKKFGISNPKKN
jgi:putative transposase